MGDWDDEDQEPVVKVQVPIVNPSRWDDEDAEEEDVKDSWDAEEPEKEKPAPKKTSEIPSPKPKQKKKLAQKIAEKKAADAKAVDPFENLTPLERKQREEKNIRESDLENAKDLFGLSLLEGSANYAYFVETLARDLCVSLSVDDVKRVSSTLTALANEKLKASKATTGKKKAPVKKATLKTGPSGADITNYDDVYDDDFDDFM
ncbi:hypothetical protein HDU96_006452 [Phlyctochytrium bullatum]|nr:hypothetical protein HDU96_006452 [Phlyctochytrium bullatum]